MRLELERESNAPVAALGETNGFHPEPSDGPSALVKQGVVAAQKGDREHARALLTSAAELDPGCEDAWMWLASISDYPEELLAFLSKVLEINPHNERAVEWHAATRSLLAKTFVERGIAAHEEGAADLANSCFDQALDNDEKCVPAWLWKARLASSDEENIKYLERVLELEPDNEEAQQAIAPFREPTPEALFEEAKWEAVAGNRNHALALLDAVFEKTPDIAEAWILRSHLFLSLNDKLSALEKALEIDPENNTARAGYDFLKTTVRDAQPPKQEAMNAIGADQDDAEPAVEELHEPVSETQYETSVEPVAETAIEPFAEVAVETRGTIDENPELASEAQGESYCAEESLEPAFAQADAGEPTAEYVDATPFIESVGGPMEEAHDTTADDTAPVERAGCAFCAQPVDQQAFECSHCHAVLTLSDIESLLANQNADRDAIQQAVTQMEAKWNLREFEVHELIVLGIGHFNLRNFDQGFKYLQEASRLDPNNVVLGGQVNSLAIRLDEMRRQDEIDGSKPKGKSILVVDDSPTVRKLISAKLEKSGHNVTCAADGVEGLEKLTANGGFDLVLLDIAMPRLDGYEVCKQIRSNPAAAAMPVVMISGKDGFFDKVRGRMAGCTGYVTKPFGPETLMKALETYLLPENGHAE